MMIKSKVLQSGIFTFPKLKIYLIDFLILSFIYFLPAVSHLTSLPLYYAEPMRIAVLFSLFHTNKINTFLIAITLPLFSMIASSHPALVKTFLISGELLLNLGLFYFLVRKTNVFTALFISIVLSKLVYYSLKFLFIQVQLINTELFSTPVIFQWIVSIALSLYGGIVLNSGNRKYS